MDIFKRSLKNKKKATSKIVFLDRPFATKDLYLNEVVFIHFIVGQELYFYVFKSRDNKAKEILDTLQVQDLINNNEKLLSIGLDSLRDNQFKSEQNLIHKFIRQVGGH